MAPDLSRSSVIYCITEILYQSIQSTIYAAFSAQTARNVVIKYFEADAHDAYLREMAGFGISHPNIIEYLDTFYIEEACGCIVYPRYELNLEQWLAKNGPAEEEFCFACLEAMLSALIHLNRLGRIHCDIKPHNVFLELSPDSLPNFILGDLGSACSLQEAQDTRYTVSTPAYLAPERVYKNFYLNSDLYSLGVMVYELAVGQRPFTGSLEEITKAHLVKQPELETIPYPLLRDFVGQMLEKDPSVRIRSAEVANYMLRNIRQQDVVDVSQSLQSPIAVTPAMQPIMPFGFFEKLHISVTNIPSSVTIFAPSRHIFTVLEYENYIEIISPSVEKKRLILKTGAIQKLDDTRFFYANGHKLMLCNLNDDSEQLIYRFKEQINFFYFGFGYLLFGNKYRNNYINLETMEAIPFSKWDYLADKHVCIFDDGSFCINSGPYNQLIVRRDKSTQMLNQWQLEGLIVGITQSCQTLLVLTIDLQNQSKYVIWSISPNGKQEKICLPDTVHLYHRSQGCFFWLTYDNRMFMCGIDLVVMMLAKLPFGQGQIKAFHFTLDHRWLAVLVNTANDENCLYCYQTHGA